MNIKSLSDCDTGTVVPKSHKLINASFGHKLGGFRGPGIKFNPVRLASEISRGGSGIGPIDVPEIPRIERGIARTGRRCKKKYKDKTPVFVGFGGNLCFGHMSLAETLEEIFSHKNVKIFTKDKNAIKKSGYKALKEKEIYDPKVVKDHTVYIISPSYTHTEYVEKLSKIEEIKGIYVDKPIGISPRDLEILKKLDASKVYAGDHYYFGNLAALRLMGVDMPMGEYVTINLDKTLNKKFTTCINEAVPYFKDNEIASIRTIMHETDDNGILRARNWYRNDMGGGILLDFQFHLHNLLNMMGLKLNQIDYAKGLKMPIKPEVIDLLNQGATLKDLKKFDKLKIKSVEEAVLAKGRINGEIPFEMDTVRGIKDNTRTLEITGWNGERILISASSSKKRVELFDRKGNIIGAAITDGEPYDLMFMDVEEKMSNTKDNAQFLKALWEAQLASLQQIFDIKKLLGNLWVG